VPEATPAIQAIALDVTSERIAACNLVKLAANRFLADLEAKESRWEFRCDLAERVMRWCRLLPKDHLPTSR
jgi:phage terminase large subunit-like protein